MPETEYEPKRREHDSRPLECPYCEEPFADSQLLALHAGLEHSEALTPPEERAYLEAYEAESEEIRMFRLKALAALVLIYFLLLFAYSFFA